MALDQKTRESDRVYEEFEPPIDWDHDEGSDTLILMLPGFKKEQLRVEVTSTRVVRVSGERQISENKWRRFRKEMAVPPDSDTSGISAKIEAGMICVRLPKMIITNNNNNKKKKKKKKKQQQSPTNNACAPIPTPSTKPTQPAAATTATVPKQEAPNPHPLQRIASYLKPSNRQKMPIVDEYLYKASEPGIDQPSDFSNIRKKLQRGNNNNDPTPTVPPTKPPQPQQPTTDQKAAAEPPQKVEKGKARILTDDDIVNKERSVEEGAAAMLKYGSGGGSDHDHGKVLEKRSLTTGQSEEYMNAVSGLVEEVKQQKKLVKVLILIFLVLLFGIYVKNMQSSHLLERTPNACQL